MGLMAIPSGWFIRGVKVLEADSPKSPQVEMNWPRALKVWTRELPLSNTRMLPKWSWPMDRGSLNWPLFLPWEPQEATTSPFSSSTTILWFKASDTKIFFEVGLRKTAVGWLNWGGFCQSAREPKAP